jgi:hypothetical protein
VAGGRVRHEARLASEDDFSDQLTQETINLQTGTGAIVTSPYRGDASLHRAMGIRTLREA